MFETYIKQGAFFKPMADNSPAKIFQERLCCSSTASIAHATATPRWQLRLVVSYIKKERPMKPTRASNYRDVTVGDAEHSISRSQLIFSSIISNMSGRYNSLEPGWAGVA